MINSILSSTSSWHVNNQQVETHTQDYAANYVMQTPHIKEVNKPTTKPDCGCNTSNDDKQENTTLLDKDKELFLKEFSNNMSILDKVSSNIQKAKTPEEIEAQTRKFIEQYNKTVDFLEEHKDENTTLKGFHKSLTSQIKTNEYSLEDIGVTVSEDGKMSIDEDKFKISISTNVDKVKDNMAYLASRTEAITNRAANASTEQLTKNNSSSNTDKHDKYIEAYHESVRMMVSSSAFMKFYTSAQATGNMINRMI